MNEPKSRFEMGVDCRFLYQRAVKMEEGEFVSYEEFSGLINRDVQKEARGTLYSALRAAERDAGAVYACVPKKGFKRLENRVISPVVSTNTTKTIRRIAGRGLKKLAVVRVNELSINEQKEHHLAISFASAMQQFSSPKAERVLREAVEERQDALSMQRALEAFKKL